MATPGVPYAPSNANSNRLSLAVTAMLVYIACATWALPTVGTFMYSAYYIRVAGVVLATVGVVVGAFASIATRGNIAAQVCASLAGAMVAGGAVLVAFFLSNSSVFLADTPYSISTVPAANHLSTTFALTAAVSAVAGALGAALFPKSA